MRLQTNIIANLHVQNVVSIKTGHTGDRVDVRLDVCFAAVFCSHQAVTYRRRPHGYGFKLASVAKGDGKIQLYLYCSTWHVAVIGAVRHFVGS